MKVFIALIIIGINFEAFAQFDFTNQIVALDKKIQNNVESISKNKSYLKELESQNLEIDLKLNRMELIKNNRDLALENVKSFFEEEIQKMPTLQRLTSRKANIYRCAIKQIQESKVIRISECPMWVDLGLTSGEKSKITELTSYLNLTEKELLTDIKKIQNNKKSISNLFESIKKSIEVYKAHDVRFNENRMELLAQKKEYDLVLTKKNILSCSKESPEVNLESEIPFPGSVFRGPFYNVPRDHQDGLGVCYANTARNLLIGLSGGMDDPSFLDLSIQHAKKLNNSSVEAGDSCKALDSIKTIGYCPQRYSPTEVGENSMLNDQILLKEFSSIQSQAFVLKSLEDLVNHENELFKSENLKVLRYTKEIIKEFESPHIVIPLPIVSYAIPRFGIIRDIYKDRVLKTFSEREFVDDYQSNYKKFFMKYLKMALDGKSSDEIFNAYEEAMGDFFKKYKIENQFEYVKMNWNSDVKYDFNDPERTQKLAKSLEFLKKYTNVSTDCSGGCMLDFNTLEVSYLRELKDVIDSIQGYLNPSLLVDSSGRLKDRYELLQLLVAPSCLNAQNRKKLSFDFSCDTIDKTMLTTIKDFRTVVLMSLLHGYPLGNSHPQIGGNHINTIVGLRYNPDNKKCEYLIRESQDGSSHWTDESSVYESLFKLWVVRRK
jgi:hypothetical protein